MKIKQFDEMSQHIIMVPFFGAKPPMLKRHKELFGSLGYQVHVVPLRYFMRPWEWFHYRSTLNFWGDQIFNYIEEFVRQFCAPFVIFSFSNPGASTLYAVSQKAWPECRGLIFDSGPSGDVFPSVIGLLKHYYGFKAGVYPLAVFTYLLLGIRWNHQVVSYLKRVPKSLPILSIRAGNDQLINVDQIDSLFSKVQGLNLQVEVFDRAAHLAPIKEDSDRYRKTIEIFLQRAFSAESYPHASPPPSVR